MHLIVAPSPQPQTPKHIESLKIGATIFIID